MKWDGGYHNGVFWDTFTIEPDDVAAFQANIRDAAKAIERFGMIVGPTDLEATVVRCPCCQWWGRACHAECPMDSAIFCPRCGTHVLTANGITLFPLTWTARLRVWARMLARYGVWPWQYQAHQLAARRWNAEHPQPNGPSVFVAQ